MIYIHCLVGTNQFPQNSKRYFRSVSRKKPKSLTIPTPGSVVAPQKNPQVFSTQTPSRR
ncbi:unnamed protein product (macronuclear) [Paramecium tetraurelia]|uniref:Uncharacterized protein n=1 Tax=Paramecium tetraurelia TaxID=5888 RepID=A0C8S1_PARTE|nr:uncharacterized protein GSPATT00036323001 [Paramecium tetraurelia]CAK67188.1 unnamed protein product [Paramecium tetraurelia]|eukprot:XP_001434585.1 hypothetical protein (macronuclear) [Paramecium tetraurelia strain d4-2]